MITVGFKTSSGATLNNFSALKVVPTFDVEAENVVDINKYRWHLVQAIYPEFEITFGFLTTAQQDYLLALNQYQFPELHYDGNTYVISVSGNPQMKRFGGKIKVVSQESTA